MADETNQSILTPVDIESEMKKSYLDYAMSVIEIRPPHLVFNIYGYEILRAAIPAA